MANLLHETIYIITTHRLAVDDIIFIGSEETGHQCSWEDFFQLANFNYDEGYGSQHIASDLSIVFADGTRMVREEYDGSEWWRVIRPFAPPVENFPITKLWGKFGGTLAELCREAGKGA